MRVFGKVGIFTGFSAFLRWFEFIRNLGKITITLAVNQTCICLMSIVMDKKRYYGSILRYYRDFFFNIVSSVSILHIPPPKLLPLYTNIEKNTIYWQHKFEKWNCVQFNERVSVLDFSALKRFMAPYVSPLWAISAKFEF